MTPVVFTMESMTRYGYRLLFVTLLCHPGWKKLFGSLQLSAKDLIGSGDNFSFNGSFGGDGSFGLNLQYRFGISDGISVGVGFGLESGGAGDIDHWRRY